jgi:Predicted oxidoreductases (related to aryl-alcohol dehydrogenases)
MATKRGTWDYRDQFGEKFARTYFRRFDSGVTSSIGIGTYLGEPTDDADDQYYRALIDAIESGVNHLDTAINYRCQRSERVVGDAIADSVIDRDAIVLATKGGFLPFDENKPADPGAYITEEFIQDGTLDSDALARGCHALTPKFINSMLDQSQNNLAVDYIDCYYLHNPETQLTVRSRKAVYEQLTAVFKQLERRRASGDIGGYGVASWNAFRVAPSHDSYLSLPRVAECAEIAAETVGADDCGFMAVQLPFNIQMADAFTTTAHHNSDHESDDTVQEGTPNIDRSTSDDNSDAEPATQISALRYAQQRGINIIASATLAQGDLTNTDTIPPAVEDKLSGETPAQRAINFTRSAPGVTTALVGTGSPEHVSENVTAGTFEPLGAQAFDAIFE